MRTRWIALGAVAMLMGAPGCPDGEHHPSGSDVGADASSDTAGDAVVDPGTDPAPESGTDPGPDPTPDPSPDPTSDPSPDPSPDPAPDPGTDPVAADDGGPATYWGDPRCEGSGFLVCESFEDTVDGAMPGDWGACSQVWLGGGYGVASDDAARGGKSLRFEGSTNGAQWVRHTAALGPLATSHWGRMFFRVQKPAPWPSEGVLHGDLFQAHGPYGANNTNRVRWGMVANTQQQFQWIYNVQKDGPEFATGTQYIYDWPDGWTCMEWYHDEATQTARLWLDEVEISDISQTAADNPEIPVYDQICVGWANYQNADPQFVVYLDEIALHTERIGCTN